LKIPHETLLPSVSQPGRFRVRLPGFGTLQKAGAPAVPVRIERIAIPENGSPALRVVRTRSRPLQDLLLESVPSPGSPLASHGPPYDPLGPPPSAPAHLADETLESSDALYPGAVAQLGKIGYLRDQRYVELILTPVQVRPRSRKATLAQELEIEISLVGSTESAVAAPRRADPHGEKLYEGSFLNSPAPGRAGSAKASRNSAEGSAVWLESSGGAAYKISVKQEGIYRISCSDVPSCSIAGLLGVDPATFRLRSHGVEVPLRILGGGDASFDPGDVLEFYGQPNPDTLTVVNCAPPSCPAPIYQSTDYTDTNVYLLDAPGSAGRVRMATLSAVPGALPAETSFLEKARAEVNDRFSPLGGNDPFYWLPTMTADATTSAARDLSVPLPGLAAASFSAPVVVRLRGVSVLENVNPDHRTRLTVNGSGATVTTFDWDGEVIFDHTTSAPQAILSNPTTLHLELVAVPGISIDQALVDYAEIDYRRQFLAESDALSYDFPNQAAKFTVQGFTGSAIAAYDVSRTLAGNASLREPRLIVGGTSGATSLTFQVAAEGAPTGSVRRFLLAGPGGYRAPDAIAPLPSNTLRDTTNEADYLIIAHPSLVDLSPGSAYQQFVSHLTTTRGLKVKLVFIQDIYDAFSDSVEDPEAIRSFLAYAHDQWTGPTGSSAPPAYLLLLGDAIWDPKNNLNRADWIDLVPAFIMFYDQAVVKFYASDSYLASFLGDDASEDILHGRIPARTLAQAEIVFGKLINYIQAPPPGAWRHDGYFLADVGNIVDETASFEGEQDSAAAFFTAPWTQTKQYYAKPPYNAPTGGNGPVAQFKADFVSHWNTAHPAIASFSGHGAYGILGNDLFFQPPDVALLTNGGFQPFFYNSDCLTGGFHAVGIDSMSEAFLESPGGGSIAYFAPSGLSFTFLAQAVSGQMFSELFGPEKVREMGTLTNRARGVLYQQGSIADAQAFTYVGEPSLSLVLPAPAPPASFAVSAGNSQVDLTWTPSTDPQAVGVFLYRTTLPGTPYQKLNASPLTGTSYTDTAVANGTTYFYRAVSVDAAGFEGAVTNTNDDCGASGPPDGPQCRRAKPQNLTPPLAPAGVKVRDTGTGTTLEVSWLPNGETDIQRYTVFYGTSPGSHPISLNAGLATQLFLSGLSAGSTYYVVVTASNTSGVEGSPSGEASGVPHVFQGIAPPATIKDLMVTRSGSDLILSWSRVTTNIYGNPTVVGHYNIYRDGTPNFVPSNSVNRIGQVADSSAPSFVHTGAATSVADSYYLVSAEDLDGNASGLGGDLPAGIVPLTVAPSPTPGMLRLSWPAASITVTGGPARISHYRLYGLSTPIPRYSISPATLLQDNIIGTSIDVPDPATARFYYNLIVVDQRGNLSPY
jgi:hypothetical protein